MKDFFDDLDDELMLSELENALPPGVTAPEETKLEIEAQLASADPDPDHRTINRYGYFELKDNEKEPQYK